MSRHPVIRSSRVFAGCLLAVAASILTASSASADFHVVEVSGGAFNQDASSSSQAGGHPYAVRTTFKLGSSNFFQPDGQFKDVRVDLPPGFVANPGATGDAVCDIDGVSASATIQNCPLDSQVGLANLWLAGGPDFSFPSASVPVYRIQALYGAPATLAFNVSGIIISLVPGLRSGSDYGIRVNVRNAPQILYVTGTTVELWGAPADATHDPQRYCPGRSQDTSEPPAFGCSTERNPVAFLTNPADCAAGPLATRFEFSSWTEPDHFINASFDHDENGNPTAATGCDQVPFGPSVAIKPTSGEADSPTGLDVDLAMPVDGLVNPDALSQSPLKRAVVTLPEGMSVNPASADGLGGCSAAQIGLSQAGSHPQFTSAADNCPGSSKIGTVALRTPLLDDSLFGSIYLATQDNPAAAGDENPFGTLLGLYLAVDDEATGTVLKLPGRVDLDPDTGQLVATFDNNPQVPFSSLELHFKTGARAPLVTPPTCGSYDIVSELSSWSAVDPDNPTPAETVSKSSSFDITSGPDGTPCPSPGKFDPAFEAGTTTPIAGAYSPLIVNASRPDGSQSLQGLSLTLPEGLTGKLAGIPACPAAALSAAADKSGAAELASPSCPAASKVGTVDVAAGAGSTPFHVTGTAYLAGPYKGAPISLAVITPALAGPFDLGTVVVRAAAQIDPVSTQIKVTSDPIPSILQGIPLKVRSVSVDTDRPEFTLNPTSCDPMSLEGTMFGSSVSKTVSNRFQVGACKALGFAPKLALSLKGPTHRRAHPALKAVLTAKPREANIARAQVKLPKAAFLDNAHIGEVCTAARLRRPLLSTRVGLRQGLGHHPDPRLHPEGKRLPACQPRPQAPRPCRGPPGPRHPADRDRAGREDGLGQGSLAESIRSGARRAGDQVLARTLRRQEGPDRTELWALRESKGNSEARCAERGGL